MADLQKRIEKESEDMILKQKYKELKTEGHEKNTTYQYIKGSVGILLITFGLGFSGIGSTLLMMGHDSKWSYISTSALLATLPGIKLLLNASKSLEYESSEENYGPNKVCSSCYCKK